MKLIYDQVSIRSLASSPINLIVFCALMLGKLLILRILFDQMTFELTAG